MVDPKDETAMIVWAHHKTQDYCPSIHMPRFASRFMLIATSDAYRERLRGITEEQARLEGVEPFAMSQAEIDDIQISDDPPEVKQFWKLMGPGRTTHIAEFQMLMTELHGPEFWRSNPEVTVIPFAHADSRGQSVAGPDIAAGKEMVGSSGLEPPASSVSRMRSNQLS